MGPQHPSTHGVLRVILKLDGEKVLGTECVIGYLHRGVEKIAENRTYAQFNPYVDRMDYVAAVSNGLGYCLAVEKMLNVEAPPRAQCVRVILTELNRIASHLLWLGTHALDIGAITPVFYCLREREEALKIFEKYCGARLTTHAFRIGGLLYETYDGFEQDIRDFCTMFVPKVDEYEELLTNNRIWKGRLVDVGILSADECKEYGVTGPVLRASGVKWDLRKAQPYSGYEKYDFEIPTRQNGDTYDRYMVRMEEMRQSVRIMQQAVDGHPRRPDHGQGGEGDQAAGGRGVRFHRSAQGRTGLLRGERRIHAAVSRARAAAIVCEFAGAGPDDPRRAGGGCGGGNRHSGYCVGRDRSVGESDYGRALKKNLPGGPVRRALGDVSKSEPEVHLHGAVSGGAAEGGGALPRGAAAQHQSR